MTVVYVWVENASERLAKAQLLLEKSLRALGLNAVRYPAGRNLCLFKDVLKQGRREAEGDAFVWCNSDVILKKNPFDVPDSAQVYGFHRTEIPSGSICSGVDMYYIPTAIWDNFLAKDIPPLYVGVSFVDWWISRAMPLYGKYENLVGYIDHPSHKKSSAANEDSNSYYQANFRAYNKWAKRNDLELIEAPPYVIPGVGHVWGIRDGIRRLFKKR
ncbi:MAG: hypothetical protein ACK5LK_02025 [Chthoniobacterales bacterium]